jgi:hypothetical protein
VRSSLVGRGSGTVGVDKASECGAHHWEDDRWDRRLDIWKAFQNPFASIIACPVSLFALFGQTCNSFLILP